MVNKFGLDIHNKCIGCGIQKLINFYKKKEKKKKIN